MSFLVTIYIMRILKISYFSDEIIAFLMLMKIILKMQKTIIKFASKGQNLYHYELYKKVKRKSKFSEKFTKPGQQIILILRSLVMESLLFHL